MKGIPGELSELGKIVNEPSLRVRRYAASTQS